MWVLTADSESNQSCLRLSDFVAVPPVPDLRTPLMREDVDGRDTRARYENARERRNDHALRTPGWGAVGSGRQRCDKRSVDVHGVQAGNRDAAEYEQRSVAGPSGL